MFILVGFPQALSFTLYHYGLHFTSPINCALLWLALTPLTAFVSMVLNREQRSWVKVLGVLLAVGMYLFCWGTDFKAGALVSLDLGNYSREGTSILGDLLVLGSALMYAGYITFTKELSVGMGTTGSSTAQA